MAITIFLFVLAMRWFSLESELQLKLADTISATKDCAAPGAQIHKELAQDSFDRTCRIAERIVLGGLMSVLTLIIGYVFGVRRSKNQE